VTVEASVNRCRETGARRRARREPDQRAAYIVPHR
jgi:hypothetical protein